MITTVTAKCKCGDSMNTEVYYADNGILFVKVECVRCLSGATIDFDNDCDLPTRLEGSE